MFDDFINNALKEYDISREVSKIVNRRAEFIKLLAVLFMVIDHVGLFFFNDYWVFRAIGRLAFPLFAYQIAQGCLYTSNMEKYILRLFIFACISQVPYVLLFGTLSFNIIFNFLMAVILIYAVNHKKYILVPFALIFAWMSSYGLYGVAIVLIFYFFESRVRLIVPAFILATLIYIVDTLALLQIFAVLALFVLYVPYKMPSVKLNKYVFYWFYPVHIILIWVMTLIL